jgi:hypothetical protein
MSLLPEATVPYPMLSLSARATYILKRAVTMNLYEALVVVALLALAHGAHAESNATGRWVDPRCTPLDITKYGPFVHGADGSLLTVDGNVLRSSTDGGKTWSEGNAPIVPGMNLSWGGHVGQFLRTQKGALVVAYLDMADYKFSWDDAKGAPNPECKLELWVIRSTDGGTTWSDKQRLLDGYNADFMGFIQIHSGRLVMTVEH